MVCVCKLTVCLISNIQTLNTLCMSNQSRHLCVSGLVIGPGTFSYNAKVRMLYSSFELLRSNQNQWSTHLNAEAGQGPLDILSKETSSCYPTEMTVTLSRCGQLNDGVSPSLSQVCPASRPLPDHPAKKQRWKSTINITKPQTTALEFKRGGKLHSQRHLWGQTDPSLPWRQKVRQSNSEARCLLIRGQLRSIEEKHNSLWLPPLPGSQVGPEGHNKDSET